MTSDEILSPIASLALPNNVELNDRAAQALKFISAFEVKSSDDYGLGADELVAIKGKRARLEAQRVGITGPLDKALKAVNALFAGPDQMLEQAELLLKKKMLAYMEEQRRMAEEARRKAEEIAAAERKRLEEQAAARAREAEEAAKAIAAANAAGDEQKAAMAQAEMQRAQSESHSAEINAQLVIAMPEVHVVATKAKGISTSKKLVFEVESLEKLLAFIVTGDGEAKLAHPQLIGLVQPDDVRLRAYVKGIGLGCVLPGVKISSETVMAARSAP